MQIPKVFLPERSKYLVFTADFLLPFFIVVSVILAIYILLYSKLFNISKITCELDFEPCKNTVILAELDKQIGQNIFKLKTASISNKFTSGDYTIREAILTKTLPNILKAELHSVYVVVAIKIKDLDKWIALDEQYRVIKELNLDPNVPTVILQGPITLALGKPIEDGVLKDTLSMARRLFEQLPTIKTINLIDENRLDVLLENGKTAILSPSKDETIQLRSLQAILQEVTISKGVRTIDVRFSQPVLR